MRTVLRPRASTLGASKGPVFVKKCREMTRPKKRRKMSLRGHDAALGKEQRRSSEIFGDELEKFWLTTKKTVVRNFARRIENIFEGTCLKKIRWHPRTSLGHGHKTAEAAKI